MAFELTSKDYVEYLKKAYVKIHESGDYITELDAATGDGDQMCIRDSSWAMLMPGPFTRGRLMPGTRR